MKINLLNLAKTTFKNLVVEDLNKKAKICYKTKYKIAEPKPITIPKHIELDKEFVEGISLYVGDGKLTPNDMKHTELATTDEDIGKFVLDFFLKRLNVKINDITFTIRYRTGSKRKLRSKWSKILNIPKDKFHFQKKKRYKMKDSITIQINSIIFRTIFQKLIENTLPIIKNDKELRRAFLRGEFAADGKIIVEKDTNTYYISEISFCYDMKKEVWLRDYIIDCLKLEGINKFSLSKDGDIRITNWKNYVKFWEMKLFDRCLRKGKRFLNIVRQMQVRLALRMNFLRKFLESTKLPNSVIRKITNLHLTNLKRVLNGTQLLRVEQIHKLLSFSNVTWRSIINNTTRIRIGRITNLNPTNKFIHFLLNEKNLN